MDLSKKIFKNKHYLNISKLTLGLLFIIILGYIIELIFDKYNEYH